MFRDAGPYSSRNSSKGALIVEAAKVMERVLPDCNLSKLRSLVLEGNLLSHRSRNTRERVWDALHHRYFADKAVWVLHDLRMSRRKGAFGREFISLLYLHYALGDRLTYEFVTEILWDRWIKRQVAVSRQDILFLLDRATAEQPQVGLWTIKTREKLSGSILTALRDFGLLAGIQRKTIVQPLLPLSTAEHLLRILIEEGKRGREVLDDPTWRLFLCDADDVADILAKLDQKRLIRFESVGEITVLHTPEEWGA